MNVLEDIFKNIQRYADDCINDTYETLTQSFSFKSEYLDKQQLNTFLEQEFFKVADELSTLRTNHTILKSIINYMDAPDFLWESGFIEILNPDERKKYRRFSELATFDLAQYKQDNTCYDDTLPYFSVIVKLVVLTKYLEYLQKERIIETSPIITTPIKKEQPPKKVQNPFEARFEDWQLQILVECINEAHLFTSIVTTDILKCFFAGESDSISLRSKNNKRLAYFFSMLCSRGYITDEWQAAISNNKLIFAPHKDQYLNSSDLSSANDSSRLILPKGYETIDNYIKQLKKH